MSNWDKYHLEEVCHKITDGTHKTPKYVDEGIVFLSAKNVKNGILDFSEHKHISLEEHNQLTKRCKPETGDVMLSKSGSLGDAVVVPQLPFEFSIFESLALIKINKNFISPLYLQQYLNSPLSRRYFWSITSGIAVKHLHLVDLRRMPIFVPPVKLQGEIVDFLEKWDAAIEKTEALIDAKERQFGWLKSKLLLRNPNAKHWKTETLGHYIEEKKDKSTVPDLYPCLTSSRRGMFLQDKYFSKQVASKDNTGYKIMSRGDFTYRSMSDDGTFVFNKQDIVDKGLISPAYGVFAPNKHMDADFLYYFLNSSAFKRALVGEIQGGTRTALKLNALKKLDVDIPELSVQQNIAHTLNTAQHEITLLKKLADKYRTQKRGLMQKLLSGEWHIKNQEAA